MKKTLYIMRGLSGSGKSTLAKKIVGKGVIFSTDNFFMVRGKYKFRRKNLQLNHLLNQRDAAQAMKDGITPVVIDNTHVQAWEARPYIKAGVKYGYEIQFIEPDTDWAFDPDQLAEKNTHGVSLAAIEKMLSRWETEITVESCLKKINPFFGEEN